VLFYAPAADRIMGGGIMFRRPKWDFFLILFIMILSESPCHRPTSDRHFCPAAQ
jgi:hypothetical protein